MGTATYDRLYVYAKQDGTVKSVISAHQNQWYSVDIHGQGRIPRVPRQQRMDQRGPDRSRGRAMVTWRFVLSCGAGRGRFGVGVDAHEGGFGIRSG